MTEPLSRGFSIDGVGMHYWEWPGSGPAIVFLHPSGHFGRIWEMVASELAPDFRVLALDQRGHGDSGQPSGGNRAEDYAADVEHLARAAGLDDFIVAGHSLGARAAMVYAAEHPQHVRQLILVGGPHYSTLHPGADADYWRNNAARMRSRSRDLTSRAAAVEMLRTQYPYLSPEAIEHCVRWNTTALPGGAVQWKYDPAWVADGLLHALDDLSGFARRVTCPTLILRADKSWELTPERLVEIEGLLRGSKTITLPGTTQNLELEAPAEVARTIRTFVTGSSLKP